MKQTCVVSGLSFEVTHGELEFLDTISPVFDGKKYSLPPPRVHPEERMRQRYCFRNLSRLHRRSCDFSSKSIISPYASDSGRKVYHTDVWWSDKWDGLEYARDFDFNRTFFEQCFELYKDVPILHHYVLLSENCEYINGAANCKNCYLSFDMDYCEHCYYVRNAINVRSTLDCLALTQCELCYECIDCENCYSLLYSFRSVNCSNSYFLSECRRCRHCIACSNLVDKEYYIFNKKSTKEEFESLKRQLRSRAFVKEFSKKAYEHNLSYPRKYYFGHSNENFTGDNVKHIKNSYNCFECFELENCLNCHYAFKSANCMDLSVFGDNSEWLYNCQATGINCSHNICCMFCWSGSSNNFYSHLINACSDCFGCSGLKNKKYCILNKQYSKEDYFRLIPRIIEHMTKTKEWGQFFPPHFSAFGVNETVALEYLPLTEREARERGYNWKTLDEVKLSDSKYLIQNSIDDIDDSLCTKELCCERSGRAYRVIPQELKLYRDLGIPVPVECPEVRYERRRKQKNPPRLYQRECAKTGESLFTSYSPEQPEIVYSESAYLEALG